MTATELARLHAEGRLLGRCALIRATHHSAEFGVIGGVVISWNGLGELGIAIHGLLDNSFFVEAEDIAAIVDGRWDLADELTTLDGAEQLDYVLATDPDIEVDPRVTAALLRARPAA